MQIVWQLRVLVAHQRWALELKGRCGATRGSRRAARWRCGEQRGGSVGRTSGKFGAPRPRTCTQASRRTASRTTGRSSRSSSRARRPVAANEDAASRDARLRRACQDPSTARFDTHLADQLMDSQSRFRFSFFFFFFLWWSTPLSTHVARVHVAGHEGERRISYRETGKPPRHPRWREGRHCRRSRAPLIAEHPHMYTRAFADWPSCLQGDTLAHKERQTRAHGPSKSRGVVHPRRSAPPPLVYASTHRARSARQSKKGKRTRRSQRRVGKRVREQGQQVGARGAQVAGYQPRIQARSAGGGAREHETSDDAPGAATEGNAETVKARAKQLRDGGGACIESQRCPLTFWRACYKETCTRDHYSKNKKRKSRGKTEHARQGRGINAVGCAA